MKLCSLINKTKLATLILVFTLFNISCLADDENFMIFTEDINGFPVPGSDGIVYFIGTTISKVHLSSRTVENVIRISTSDLSDNLTYDKGLLNHQESVLIAFRTTFGPN